MKPTLSIFERRTNLAKNIIEVKAIIEDKEISSITFDNKGKMKYIGMEDGSRYIPDFDENVIFRIKF